MKYGKTERISGIVILLALLAIFVPWLMSDPAPREERPQPSFVIEQPVEVERRDVPAPERPSTIGEPSLSSTPSGEGDDGEIPIDVDPRLPETDQIEASNQSPSSSEAPATNSDPIADLIASNSGSVQSNAEASSQSESQSSSQSSSSSASSPPASAQGEWAVQVGSFGEPANARRLSEQLSGQGFTVYQRERDNNMTTVFVGPYATSEDGESAMSSIKERANVQGLLVRVRD
ncbi:SPOR domain-containing protein [Halomonas alkaliantarctica]|uniref:SPOR domain-containing protein n=1 Tax=Halomonas alkaliantarctica TaxID=232346 RepID=A0ABY8LKG2_9GAMM|nr:SPOR domain-containing protein [Halomonas alkaliantarctica]WGI23814.1 SPOR domain-containing protein [Halomonas alkaliantarctica]